MAANGMKTAVFMVFFIYMRPPAGLKTGGVCVFAEIFTEIHGTKHKKQPLQSKTGLQQPYYCQNI